MALIECPECGANLSDQAWSCPSCGAKNMTHWFHNACDQHWWWVKGLFKWVGVIVLSLLIVYSLVCLYLFLFGDWTLLGWLGWESSWLSIRNYPNWLKALMFFSFTAGVSRMLAEQFGMIKKQDD